MKTTPNEIIGNIHDDFPSMSLLAALNLNLKYVIILASLLYQILQNGRLLPMVQVLV